MDILMRITCIILTLLFIISPSVTAAPYITSGRLAGTVTDAKTNEALVSVNIVIMKTKLGGTTNEKGEFRILNIPAGKYNVQFSYVGYKKSTVEDLIIHVNQTTSLDIKLEPGDLVLDEVVIAAERLTLKKDITGTTFFVPAAQILELPVDNIQGIVASHPGVTRDLHIRGGRKTEILYLVDGLPFTEAGGGAIGGMLPKSAMMEMKIQTGGFEAEYGNALSGVINIVTRKGTDEQKLFARTDVDHFFGNPETNYANEFEFSLSGPTRNKDITYFSATDFKTSYTRWQQDFRDFFNDPVSKGLNNTTRFDYSMTEDLRLYLQVITTWQNLRDYEFRWRGNLTGLPPRKKLSYRISTGISQFLSRNTFYNFNISRYHLNSHLGLDKKSSLDKTDLFQYDAYLQYVISGSRLWWADENQTSWTVKTDLTTIFAEHNDFKMGAEFTTYTMDIDRIKIEPQFTYFGKPLVFEEPFNHSTTYLYRPRTGAAYMQSKMRFADGGTFSVGLRWDFLDPRASRPNLEWVPEGEDAFKQNISEWVPAEVKQCFSPRIGFSFPVSENGFVFFNFGKFFQVPLFDYLYSGLDINLKKGQKTLIGNPDMKPQKTTSLELSYRRQFPYDIALIITAFKKNTKNLIDTKTFLASDSKALDDGYFAQYVNSPAAVASGIEVSIEKDLGAPVKGRLSYTYMKTEATSEWSDQGLNYLQWGFQPAKKFYPLSWDQRHTFDAVIMSDLPMGFTCDIMVNYHSPRPYTYYPSRDGFTPPGTVFIPNNRRMKENLYIDLKATKTFTINLGRMKQWQWLIYYDVRNILNRKNLLWVASDGVPGGELLDPGAYAMLRRTRIGMQISFK